MRPNGGTSFNFYALACIYPPQQLFLIRSSHKRLSMCVKEQSSLRRKVCTQPMLRHQIIDRTLFMGMMELANTTHLIRLRTSFLRWALVESVLYRNAEEKSQTISAIGPDRFIAICSDNTNVTKAARRKITAEHSFILNINDCVHHLHSMQMVLVTQLATSILCPNSTGYEKDFKYFYQFDA